MIKNKFKDSRKNRDSKRFNEGSAEEPEKSVR